MNDQERQIATAKLGGQVICRTCGATLATFDAICSAPLDAWCDGFDAIEWALGYPGGRPPGQAPRTDLQDRSQN